MALVLILGQLGVTQASQPETPHRRQMLRPVVLTWNKRYKDVFTVVILTKVGRNSKLIFGVK